MAAPDSDTQNGTSIYEELSAAEKDSPSKDEWPSPVQAVESKESNTSNRTSEKVKLPSRYLRKCRSRSRSRLEIQI